MKILTIGLNPFLNLKNAKINRSLLKHFSQTDNIESIVLNFDNIQFLSKENGYFWENTKLHPYSGEKGGLQKFIINICKKVQPDIIITIGDYSDHFAIWQIKERYPNLFKWICILVNGLDKINLKFAECLKLSDLIITTTQNVQENLKKYINNNILHIPYGTCNFYSYNTNRELKVLLLSKNYQTSNLQSIFNAIKYTKLKAYLHTNINDSGDNDLSNILTNYNIELPYKYVSNHEGYSDEELNQKINECKIVIDCSFYSSTGLSLLDGMAGGCLPIGINYGAVGEIINNLPEEYRFFVNFNKFYGNWGEKYAVIDESHLSVILEILKKKDKGWWEKGEYYINNVLKKYKEIDFFNKFKEEAEKVIYCEDSIIVDVY